MTASTIIAPDPPNDGQQYDCQCARCGSSMTSSECGACGGDGITGPGELYEQDPLWYDEDDVANCSQCGGQGGWMVCMSPAEWCETHPMIGREKTPRHTTEWFRIDGKDQRELRKEKV